MTREGKSLDTQKEELGEELGERTRPGRCFVPRTDIYETEDQIVIIMDVPGASKDSIVINLEKNVLTINGYLASEPPDGYTLARSEYPIGDYERSFRITDKLDREAIEAQYNNGVLTLRLPKVPEAKKRKIAVSVG